MTHVSFSIVDAPRPLASPPLQNGDNLTATEFARRWDAAPSLVRAELLDGIVYLGGPVSATHHARPSFTLAGLLGRYEAETPGVAAAIRPSVRLDERNMPQPDVCLCRLPECGGTSHVGPDDLLTGPPELVVEIVYTAAAYDLHQKAEVYRRFGVREVFAWRTYDAAFDHLELRVDRYETVSFDHDGLQRSRQFPGLWINVTALLAGNTAAAIADLHRGLASPEHTAFAADLAGRRTAGVSST